jgi:hypothetical protein
MIGNEVIGQLDSFAANEDSIPVQKSILKLELRVLFYME